MDKELWSALTKGSEQALVNLYERHHEGLYNYGYRLSSNQEITRDCIQELFLDLWHKRKQLKSIEYVKAYLHKMLRNKIVDVVKENGKFSFQASFREIQEFTLSQEDILILEEYTNEQTLQLKQALSNLSHRQKEMIFLRFYSELSYEDIAEITSLKYQSIRNLLYEALRNLRKQLLLLFLILIIQ
ncbi:sigma-70 family RNA polymerase sigma factor [Rapidithrix thailandica]|uniref:Sigma-70 family RNA polymerase sigma factor n=1 Tax=Rapidithrix thailandica TaxID=413964 RepID=A0AAW9RSC6_9BACT